MKLGISGIKKSNTKIQSFSQKVNDISAFLHRCGNNGISSCEGYHVYFSVDTHSLAVVLTQYHSLKVRNVSMEDAYIQLNIA